MFGLGLQWPLEILQDRMRQAAEASGWRMLLFPAWLVDVIDFGCRWFEARDEWWG